MLGVDLVVFDIAGTTIHATDQVPVAFGKAFANVGISLSDEEIQAVRGKSKSDAIADLLHRQADATEVYDDFRRILLQRYESDGVEAIDGAEATFAWLHRRNVKIALTTGFDCDLAQQLIRNVGWRKPFDAVVCSTDVERGRPAPDLILRAMDWTGCRNPHRVVAVGDTVSDLQAAGNAGVRWSVGVLSGAHTERQLKGCHHTAIINSVAELPDVFARMIC